MGEGEATLAVPTSSGGPMLLVEDGAPAITLSNLRFESCVCETN